MKKQHKGVLLILMFVSWVAILASGCRKDLGNYDYTPIDSLGINNVQDSYQFTIGTKANIFPELKFVQGTDFNEADYSYEWASYLGNTTPKKIVHTGKNLDIEIPLGIGNYRFYYVVKQKSTGITWQKNFTVAVFGTFQPGGWFVLNDIAGKARLDYYQENRDTWNTFPTVYRDFTSLIKDVNTGNSMELTGEPISITTFNNRDAINTSNDFRLYINTTKQTQWINITNGFTWDKLRYVFANETISGEPANVAVIHPGNGGAYAYKDHNLYLYNFVYSLYGTPINRISNVAGTFPISEHIAAPYSATNSTMHAVFFDTQNKRFLRTFMSSVGATPITGSGYGLDLANVGKDLVWMGYTRVTAAQAIAILKDGSNRYYLARLNFPYSTTATGIMVTVASFDEITNQATALAAADKFAVDQQYGYLFYVSGGKLYQFDMDSKVAKIAHDYGNRTVSVLKINPLTRTSLQAVPSTPRLFTPGYGIVVGSYDPQSPTTSGTVDFYTATGLMGDLTVSTPQLTGLGKVVDVKYSEL